MNEQLKAAMEVQHAVQPKDGFTTSSFAVTLVTYAVGLFITFAISKGWIVDGPETEQLKAGLVGLVLAIMGFVTYKFQQGRQVVTEAKSESTKVVSAAISEALIMSEERKDKNV